LAFVEALAATCRRRSAGARANSNAHSTIRAHRSTRHQPAPALLFLRTRQPRGEDTMTIKIVPNDKGNPPGKLAEAELHFTHGPLEGLKLIGFAVWERKTGNGRNVTFPARQYSVNGERRSYSLLRPIGDVTAQDRLRDLILQAYAEYETQAAVAS
jgi:hypothetical protein